MANYIVSDTDLTLVADAIRAKGNTSDPLVFPDGFSDAITNISTSSGSSTTPKYTTATITPSESIQYATPPSGYDALSRVTVNPISSTYVGSGVAKKSSTDLTASGAIVTVSAGYYASQVTKSVSTTTLATPTATKGTVSNNQVSVTPSITQTAGYVTGETKSGTAVTVKASDLVSGDKSITANGNSIDVTNYKTVSVNVPTSSGTDTTIASGGATASDIASGKKAYVNGELVTGNVQVKGEYIQYRINDASTGSEENSFYLYNTNPSDILLRKNAVVYLETSRSNFGNATAEDVTAGKTFTSVDGLKIVGTKEEPTYSETTGYIDRKQGNPASSATSQTFTGMKGEPNWFVYTIAASSLPTASGYTRCVNIIYDGTNLVGSALGTLGTYSDSYFTKSYSGTSLTVGTTGSSTGGYVHNSSASEGYRLLYGYGGAHVNKQYIINYEDSVSFTGINKKPDWFCIYTIQNYGASSNAVIDVVYDGKNIYGNYTASNSVKYATDFTYAYSGTTLTINSNSASSFDLTDEGYCLIYGYANESEDSGSEDSGGGDSGGGGATVDSSKTVKPSAASTSISFTGLSAEPKSFSIVAETQFNGSTTGVAIAVHGDLSGTTKTLYGTSIRGSSSWGSSSTIYVSNTYYTYTYSNGTLTVNSSSATNGGNFSNSVTYRLIYTY